jgi:hypothetical protein
LDQILELVTKFLKIFFLFTVFGTPENHPGFSSRSFGCFYPLG